VFDAAMPTCAERIATPGFTLSNSSPTILMTGGSLAFRPFSFAAQIEIGSVLKT
jgi:hypothetical protein